MRRDKRGRLVCVCGGYWFPHRKAGGACDHSKTRDIHHARRTGDWELILTAVAEHAWDHGGSVAPLNSQPPF